MFSRQAVSDPIAEMNRRRAAHALRVRAAQSGAAERIAAAQAKRNRKNAKRAAILRCQQEAA